MPLISLVGLPGSGKSTVGARLAVMLGTPFFDCDTAIEITAGLSVSELFARDGESTFRRHEAEAIKRLTDMSDGVLATGGGAVVDAENRRILRERSTVVYLAGDPAEIAPRLRGDASRPLLAGSLPLARLAQLSAERDSLYRATAHLVVNTGIADAHEVATRVLQSLAARLRVT